ncbi:MAG TPA: isopentenyl-diphosphate Delta-isomerase [Alphaproteobacteria bacterium]
MTPTPDGGTRECVVLVDAADQPIGVAEKLAVHRANLLHRAVSVLIFDWRGRMLLQRRAFEKYHSGGLWSNACCGHPRPDEDAAAAAHRRLAEELGIVCTLVFRTRYQYQADLGDGLYENEIVHVFVGRYEGRIVPNPDEVVDVAWADPAALRAETAACPERYSAWFRKYARTAWFAG